MLFTISQDVYIIIIIIIIIIIMIIQLEHPVLLKCTVVSLCNARSIQVRYNGMYNIIRIYVCTDYTCIIPDDGVKPHRG